MVWSGRAPLHVSYEQISSPFASGRRRGQRIFLRCTHTGHWGMRPGATEVGAHVGHSIGMNRHGAKGPRRRPCCHKVTERDGIFWW
jgi:hypothetical protein